MVNLGTAKIKKIRTFWIEYSDLVLVLTHAKDQ